MMRAAWPTLLFAGGCSLLGLDDFDVVDCGRDNGPCRSLNDELGIDLETAERVYQCAPDGLGCVLGPKDWDRDGVLSSNVPSSKGELRDCDDDQPDTAPGRDERCDGRDNDCDGVIDEGVSGTVERPLAELGAVFDLDFGTPGASRSSGELDLMVVGARAQEVPEPDVARLRVLGDALSDPVDVVVSDRVPAERPSCPRAGDDEHVACVPARIVSDGHASGARLAAAIDRLGCADGVLRVGKIVDGTFRVSGRPAEGRERCTGGYPAIAARADQCTAHDALLGLSTLELARLPLDLGRQSEALLAFTGQHPLGHDVCGKASGPVAAEDLDQVDRSARTAVPVAALGIWHETLAEPAVWTTRENGDEAPAFLGMTRGGGAPAIEPIVLNGSAQYLVAVGGEDGPALHAVAQFEAESHSCTNGEPPNVTLQVRSAEPWLGSEHETADHLRAAQGTPLADACGTNAPGARVGLAWLEGCGEAESSVWFATIDFAPATGFCAPSEPLRVATFETAGKARRSMLSIAYAATGVRSGERGGGYWLAFASPAGAAQWVRIAERDSLPVEAPRPLAVRDARHVELRVGPDDEVELLTVHGAADAYRLSSTWVSGVCEP